jgi:hypothetical protein
VNLNKISPKVRLGGRYGSMSVGGFIWLRKNAKSL